MCVQPYSFGIGSSIAVKCPNLAFSLSSRSIDRLGDDPAGLVPSGEAMSPLPEGEESGAGAAPAANGHDEGGAGAEEAASNGQMVNGEAEDPR